MLLIIQHVCSHSLLFSVLYTLIHCSYINITGHSYNQEMHLLKFRSFFVIKKHEVWHAAYFHTQTSTRLQWHMPIGSQEKSTTRQYLTYTSERIHFKENLPSLLAWRSASNFLRTFIILIVVSAAEYIFSPLFSTLTVCAFGQYPDLCPCHLELGTAVQCNPVHVLLNLGFIYGHQT